ncbi:sulfatase-like hydrolase/transferase [Natronorubrum thiooxidans]|nr:sulfatase-like hydrolase/transferase [Natronorubrum thiooxidans]
MGYLHNNWYIDSPTYRYFDRWEMPGEDAPVENKIDIAIQCVDDADGSWFGLVNLSETHYPYGGRCDLSHDDLINKLADDERDPNYETAHDWQISACRNCLDSIQRLVETVPPETNIIITSDHGELFGENGGYGHNYKRAAVFHEKLFEVPLLSWVKGTGNSTVRKDDTQYSDDIPESVRERLVATGYLEDST